MSAPKKFKRGDLVAWHGAGPYVWDRKIGDRHSHIVGPDGLEPPLARDINLTPYQPTEYEDAGLVECEYEYPSIHHINGHRPHGSCVNPQPLYRRVHVCGPFEERFVEGQFGMCFTPYHVRHPHEVVDTCESWYPLGTMESVCTVCGVGR